MSGSRFVDEGPTATPSPEVERFMRENQPLLTVRAWAIPDEGSLGVLASCEWRDSRGETFDPGKVFAGGDPDLPSPGEVLGTVRHVGMVAGNLLAAVELLFAMVSAPKPEGGGH